MKRICLYCIGLLAWVLAACQEEENIIADDSVITPRYVFPQGNQAWDKIAQEIHDQYGVYVIYKNIDTLDFRRAWTNLLNPVYTGDNLTDEQAAAQIEFMRDHIFRYIPVELCRQLLPPYYYLMYNFSKNGAGLLNYTEGLDYWVSSIYSPANLQPLSTPEKQKEYRVRIFKLILETGINRERIKIPAAFNEGFDYRTALVTYPVTDANSPLKRGFPGMAIGDVYKLSSLYSITNITPTTNFISYLFLCMRYTNDEFIEAFPPDDYPRIAEKRHLVLTYIKEKYGIDLKEIAIEPGL